MTSPLKPGVKTGGLVHSDAIKERLLAKVEGDPNGGCWLWSGRVDPDGYGRIGIRQSVHLVHRASFEAFIGSAEGASVLHRCDRYTRLDAISAIDSMLANPDDDALPVWPNKAVSA